jgi:hypothetical protein
MIEWSESNSTSVRQGGFEVSLHGLHLIQSGMMENVSASRPKSIPGEIQNIPPRSSARSLLKHAGKWSGNDLEKCMQEVYTSRGELEF